MIYPNECKLCGKPKHGGEYCAACWLSLPRQEVHCITAGKDDLAGVVAMKEKQGKGFKKHGSELPIGGGYWTQMMVKR